MRKGKGERMVYFRPGKGRGGDLPREGGRIIHLVCKWGEREEGGGIRAEA